MSGLGQGADPLIVIGASCKIFLFSFKNKTYSAIPSLNIKFSDLLMRSSIKSISMPGFKKASSLSLFASSSNLNYRVVMKISGSGEKAIRVPVRFVSPIIFIFEVVMPLENSIL